MKKRKLIACILLLSIFSIFITSCSEQPKPPTEKTILKVCIESSQLDDLKPVFSYYHQLYQDVVVQPILLPAGKEQRETELKKYRHRLWREHSQIYTYYLLVFHFIQKIQNHYSPISIK